MNVENSVTRVDTSGHIDYPHAYYFISGSIEKQRQNTE